MNKRQVPIEGTSMTPQRMDYTMAKHGEFLFRQKISVAGRSAMRRLGKPSGFLRLHTEQRNLLEVISVTRTLSQLQYVRSCPSCPAAGG